MSVRKPRCAGYCDTVQNHEEYEHITSKSQHTPTPWEHQGTDIYHEKHWIAKTVDARTSESNANAAFIVRAANAHETLLKIVKELAEIPTIDETPGIAKGVFSEMDELICEAREAIAKAEGK